MVYKQLEVIESYKFIFLFMKTIEETCSEGKQTMGCTKEK